MLTQMRAEAFGGRFRTVPAPDSCIAAAIAIVFGRFGTGTAWHSRTQDATITPFPVTPTISARIALWALKPTIFA